jgi:NTP pyrophosphatase (non-canonical NTP hydrolase)
MMYDYPEYDKSEARFSLRRDANGTSSLTFDELRIANQERLPDFAKAYPGDESDWTPADWAVAAAGELGELCNLLKKRRRGQDISTVDLAKEIADTVTYLDFVAWKLGIDLGKATIDKFNEVSERVGSHVRL